MSSFLVCPECKRKLKAPEPALARATQCPACKAIIPAAEGEAEPAAGPRDGITADPGQRTADRPRSVVGRDAGGRPETGPAAGRKPVRKRSSSGLVLGLVLGGGFLLLLLGGGCTGLLVYLAVFRDRTIPDAEWQTFAPPNGHFTVSLPGTPVNTSQVVNGVSITKYEVKRVKDNRAFVVGVFDVVPQAIRPTLLDDVTTAERDHLLRTINGRVTGESPVTLGGIEGREFQIVAPDRSLLIGRIYLAQVGGKHRVFEVVVGGGVKPGKGDAERFFKSFQIDLSAQPPARGPVAQGPPAFRPPPANPPAPKGAPKARPKKQRDRSALPGERPVWHEVGGEQTISLAFAPDGATLAVGHWNKRLRLWDVAGSTDRQVFPLDFAPTALAYSKDGTRLALGTGNGRVFLWDAAARKEVQRFQVLHTRHKDQIEVVALTFAPDGKALAVGVGPGGNSDGEVHLWDLEANRERVVSPNCGEKMKRLAFAPGGALVVLMPFSVKVCDAATLQFRREFKAPRWEEQFVTSALSPDGQTLATFGADRKLKLWRLADGACTNTWQMKAEVHQSSYFPTEYSPDGKLLVLGCLGPNLYVWDAQAGKELTVRRLGQSAGNVDVLTFSPDGRLLACHSSNGPAILEVDKALAGDQPAARGRAGPAGQGPRALGAPRRPVARPPVPTDWPGLLAYWALDEPTGGRAADSAPGGASAATVHGGKWVEGVRGKALELDGVTDYVDCGAAPALNLKAGAPFTVAGWVRTARRSGTVVSLRNSKDGGALIDLVIDDGRLKAQVREDGKEFGQHAELAGGAVADGDWHHFALTRTGTAIELYLDGASLGRAVGRDAGGPITTDLRALGSERVWAQRGTAPADLRFLQGGLDEVCVFGRALSAEEIKKLAGLAP